MLLDNQTMQNCLNKLIKLLLEQVLKYSIEKYLEQSII